MDNILVEDSAPQIWSICLSHADKFDRALVETWKGDMDGILIFSGLFSAVVTAFLIISYPGLQPDVPTINAHLTARVATILANPTNQSNLSDPVTSRLVAQLPQPNSRTAYFIINALWFLSLAFSLSCALAATLVQQWSRTYLQGTEEPFKPRQRVRMRTFLQGGVQKFHFSELVDAIPMLLHVALFLFLSGLIVFLYNIKTALAHIMLVFSIFALSIYVLLTSLPVFFYDCPYKTPLTFVLSYIAYAIATCRHRGQGNRWKAWQWHPKKQSTHLTAIWAQRGSKQGADLDHAALSWTLLALTDPNDLELFVKALQSLLQSDSGTTLTRDGGRTAQALLFGPDMLAMNIVPLLRSAIPSDALAPSPVDRRRLDVRAATCLSTISLLARACDGPTQSAYHLWGAWATSYSNPVVRGALSLCDHPQPALATLAKSTVFLLAWRALVTYRTFLAFVHERATTTPAVPYARLPSEMYDRLLEGSYLAQALRLVLRRLSGDPADGTSGGALLVQPTDELIDGALDAYMRRADPRTPGTSGLAAGGVIESEMGTLAKAVQADMVKAKTCLAVLFMHAACALPDNVAGEEALQALAAPLGWRESCEYDAEPKAMGLLLAARHAHGEDTLTVLDADQVVALYLSIHDPQAQVEPPDANAAEGPNEYYMRSRKPTWKQATL